ncbi:hypothetical protein MP638_000353, partial [Amoeboaphelidium occidentale]
MPTPLAVIGKILRLNAIEQADRIVLASVDCGEEGLWKAVVAKKEIHEGNFVYVFLQDAILPSTDPRWEFLKSRQWRIRMSRFKGVPSECLAVLATPKQDGLGEGLQVGMDITSAMGVLKYSKDKVVKGKRIFNETRQTENNLAPFPEFIPKTNESNFQRIRDYAKKMEGAWIATLKSVIGKILRLNAIEQADRIVLASVDCGEAGLWKAVVAKKEIHEGNFVYVFLQDAILPSTDPRWEFLKSRQWRIRMSRFKGVPSECLAFPATPKQDGLGEDLQVGMDITSVMGVLKYSKDQAQKGKKGWNGPRQPSHNMPPFPDFIPKTDEPHFQVIRDYAKKMAGLWITTLKCDGSSLTVWRTKEDGKIHKMAGLWIATLKCDGSSLTVWRTKEDGKIHVASRNYEIPRTEEATSIYWQMAKQYRMEESLPLEYALQMEVIGPKVNGNRMKLNYLEVRAFSLFHIEKGCYQPRETLEK